MLSPALALLQHTVSSKRVPVPYDSLLLGAWLGGFDDNLGLSDDVYWDNVGDIGVSGPLLFCAKSEFLKGKIVRDEGLPKAMNDSMSLQSRQEAKTKMMVVLT